MSSVSTLHVMKEPQTQILSANNSRYLQSSEKDSQYATASLSGEERTRHKKNSRQFYSRQHPTLGRTENF